MGTSNKEPRKIASGVQGWAEERNWNGTMGWGHVLQKATFEKRTLRLEIKTLREHERPVNYFQRSGNLTNDTFNFYVWKLCDISIC